MKGRCIGAPFSLPMVPPRPGTRPVAGAGRGRRAFRDGFECERELGSLWYVGSTRQVPEGDPFLQQYKTWGEVLSAHGYTSFPALALIFDTHDPTATDIDPNHTGTLILPEDESTAANGGNPYRVNKLWTSRRYNYKRVASSQI